MALPIEKWGKLRAAVLEYGEAKRILYSKSEEVIKLINEHLEAVEAGFASNNFNKIVEHHGQLQILELPVASDFHKLMVITEQIRVLLYRFDKRKLPGPKAAKQFSKQRKKIQKEINKIREMLAV